MPFPKSPPDTSESGALTMPRQLLRWLDINPVTRLTRTQAFITLPTFSVPATWLGYSDIVASFNFEGPNNFSLSSLNLSIPINPNYLLAIMWTDSSHNVFRYAIWKNVGEVIYFPLPLYTGQKIGKNFRFEIWSTNSTPAVQSSSILLYTSVLGNVDYRWGTDFTLVNNDAINTSFSASLTGGPKVGVTITGAGTSIINGTYIITAVFIHQNVYTLQQYPAWNSGAYLHPYIQKNTGSWWIYDNTQTPQYASNGVASSPDLASSWSLLAGSNPTPTVVALLGGSLPLVFPVGSYPQLN